MTTVQQLVPLFEQFKQAYNANKYAEATSALNQLKKRFVGLKSFLPQHQPKGAVPQDVRQEILLVRETLELAILLSAKTKDLESFERNMSQVKTYYSFTATNIEKSAREQLIQGLNLMRLLAQNKIADFHTELELIPIDLHSNMYIKYPIDLELYLMEGSHNKLRQARAQVPVPEYLIFMDILMETVRKEIASCAQQAYNTLSLSSAAKLLLLQNEGEALAFAAQRNWKVHNNVIDFENKDAHKAPFHQVSKDIIAKTLSYAKEMERII